MAQEVCNYLMLQCANWFKWEAELVDKEASDGNLGVDECNVHLVRLMHTQMQA